MRLLLWLKSASDADDTKGGAMQLSRAETKRALERITKADGAARLTMPRVQGRGFGGANCSQRRRHCRQRCGALSSRGAQMPIGAQTIGGAERCFTSNHVKFPEGPLAGATPGVSALSAQKTRRASRDDLLRLRPPRILRKCVMSIGQRKSHKTHTETKTCAYAGMGALATSQQVQDRTEKIQRR